MLPHSSGVEDTRLEAKAKDKKNPRSRPRTAFSRTNTLEAKDRNARDQGQGAIFCKFFEKNSYFNAIESHFKRVQSHLKALNF